MTDRPTLLFACIHNSGRSVAAQVLTEHYAGGAVEVLSAGSEPGRAVNPMVAQVLAEHGLPVIDHVPTLLDPTLVRRSDVVVTMGCGETCPVFPGKRYEDWSVDDPAGRDVTVVRRIVSDVDTRVRALLAEVAPDHPVMPSLFAQPVATVGNEMSADQTTDTAARPPELLIFDVNETLSDMRPLAAAFPRVGLEDSEVEPWFASVLRDGFALTSVGVNPAFADVAAEALRVRLAARGVSESRVDTAAAEVMGAFTSLEVHPDVVAGVKALRQRGVRLVTLTNGSTSVAQGLLDRAGLSDDFERLMSVEDAPAWKPSPDSYAYALTMCEVAPADAMLVAVHPWDIDGAVRAGLRSAWLNRRQARYPSYFRAPDEEAPDLLQLVHAWP